MLRKTLPLIILAVTCTSFAAAATQPSVSVSAVNATSPVLRTTGSVSISATVTPSYDALPSATHTDTCGPNGPPAGKVIQTITDITYTIDKTLSVTAGDGINSTVLTGSSPGGGAFSGSLTPSTGADGSIPVTVSATVGDTITEHKVVTTVVWTGASCTGDIVSSTPVTTDTPITKSNTGTGSGSYVLDVAAPVLTLHPVTSQPTVQQGQDKNIHNDLIAGSSGTAYTLTDTVTGPGDYTASANGSGTFNPAKDGVAPSEHSTVGVKIACDAPVGIYTARAVASTVDLGGNPFSTIQSVDVPGSGNSGGSAVDTFTVTPGFSLLSQSLVVSELPPSGDYAPMSCFSSGTSGRKVTTFPGSLHLTTVLNSTGQCAGITNISGASVTLTLPFGFSFDVTGGSPAAHVFRIAAGSGGFDYHYPGPELVLPKSKISINGQTLTVDLSGVDFGLGVGVIPSADSIYVRAHAVFTGSTVPADGTQYVFQTGSSANLGGNSILTASSQQVVTASQACVNGN